MATNQDNEFFKCDECNAFFTVGGGSFIGSLDDFEFINTKGDLTEEINSVECSPFAEYVQLCPTCYSLKNDD